MPSLSRLPSRRSPVKVWRTLGFLPYRLLCAYAGHPAGIRVFVQASRNVQDSYALWFADGTRLYRHWIPAHAFTTFFERENSVLYYDDLAFQQSGRVA